MKKISNIIAKSIFVVLIFILGVMYAMASKDESPKDTVYEDTLEEEKRKAEGYCPKYPEGSYLESLNDDIVSYNQYIDLYDEYISEIDEDGINEENSLRIWESVDDKSDDISELVLPAEFEYRQSCLAVAYSSLESAMRIYYDNIFYPNIETGSYEDVLNESKEAMKELKDVK